MRTLTLVSALLHALVAWRLLPAIEAYAGLPAAVALGALLVASALIIPLALRTRSGHDQPGAQLRAWASLTLMGLFSSIAVLTLMREFALLALHITEALGLASPAADVAGASAVAVPLLAGGLTALGLWNARRPAQVKAVDVPVRGLPAGLHGFRIAQISDIHVGPTIRGDVLHGIVRRVNALEADMVAVTGDLVDGSVAELGAHVAPLAGLRSRHGSFFVTGNHEYYAGAVSWIVELRRLGLTVLMNEHVVLRHDDEPLVVAGVADWSAHHFEPSHRSDPHRARAGAPHDAIKLLLAHQPRSAAAAADAGFHLQLSGHTHGGQFLPWNFFVRLQQPFTAGLHAVRGLWVYVSRGTGYWGPPKRLGAPSEITHLRLVAG